MYTYGTGLELNSPRFSGPGDFAVFVAFLWLAIMVSVLLTSATCYRCLFPALELSYTSDICPPSLILAEAVPGTEEDYPCTSYGSSFASLESRMRCRHGGTATKLKPGVITCLPLVGLAPYIFLPTCISVSFSYLFFINALYFLPTTLAFSNVSLGD